MPGHSGDSAATIRRTTDIQLRGKEVIQTMPFVCSICGEPAARICARCTKDACDNHICEKCLRCSDCCECDLALDEPMPTPAHLPASVEPEEMTATDPPAEPETASPEEPASGGMLS